MIMSSCQEILGLQVLISNAIKSKNQYLTDNQSNYVATQEL